MATLSQYVAANPGKTHEKWAAEFGISRSYFTELLAGTHTPSAKLMIKIQLTTSGAVTPNDWLQGAA